MIHFLLRINREGRENVAQYYGGELSLRSPSEGLLNSVRQRLELLINGGVRIAESTREPTREFLLIEGVSDEFPQAQF